MKKSIILTESQLTKIVENVILEQNDSKDITRFQLALKNTEFGSLLGNTGPNNDGVDGDFGNKTKNALRKFQEKNKIVGEDGMFGPKTSKLLMSLIPSQTSTNKNKRITEKTPFLFFDGKVLSMNDGKNMIGNWYANSGPKGLKDLSKHMFKKDYGPTPEGVYYLGEIQKRTNGSMVELYKNKTFDQLMKELLDERKIIGNQHNFNSGTKQDIIAWGDYRIPIIPKSGTNTGGRHSMYIHGGGTPGTIGCIDLLDQITNFVKLYQSILNFNRLKTLPLFVDYSGNFEQPRQNYILQLPKKSANDPTRYTDFLTDPRKFSFGNF